MIQHLRRAGSVGCAWLLLAWSARGQAVESGVSIALDDCPTLSESTLREHLELELRTLELSRSDSRLSIRCRGSAVAIELTRASGARYPVEVRVDVRDTARAARERLIALAATELIAQAERIRPDAERQRARSAQQPGRSAAAPSGSAGPAPDDVPQPTPVSPRRYSELFLAGNVALDGKPATTLWGGSLGTALGLTQTWSLLLDTRFEHGETLAELASVRWSVLSGFVGPLARGQLGPLRPAAGLGLRAGWLALDATATAPDRGLSMTAPWAGLALPLRLGLELGGFVVPFLGAEAGLVVVPVVGNVDDGSLLIAQRGVWLSAHLGVGFRL